METKLKTHRNYLVVCLIVLYAINLKAALCVSTGNGNWNNPSSWSCGSVPACGDSVVVLSGHSITNGTQQDYSGCSSGPNIVVYGTLLFDNGFKIKLPCDARIYIMPGGAILPGTGGGNSNYIEICNDVLWSASSGTLSGPSCLPPTAAWCMSVVLPVELVGFKGEAKDGYVDLFWSTASEKNSSRFEIERSADASAFEKINSINSKAVNGNSNAIINYSSTDNLPLGKVIYYRLKQVDKDNTFEYSSIISVNYIKAKNVRFIVYPNPNKGEFTADVSGIENNHEIQISMRDEKGNYVYKSTFFIQDQVSNKLSIIPESKLANGTYICTLTLEGIDYNVKVIIN